MARPAGKVDLELARVLREIRSEKNLTREAVAHLAGVNLTTIASIEQGKSNPTWATVRDLTTALDVTLGDLVARIED